MKVHLFGYEMLKKWSEGEFISDWDENLEESARFEEKNLEDIPIEEQPFYFRQSIIRIVYWRAFVSWN